MEITFAKCEQILDTLPIGYYAGRRIGISLLDNIETSYYSPMEDKISISYPIIHQGMEKIDEEEDVEGVVRSMMYHEVSHAILTPIRIKPYDQEEMNVINIFEDERIESILRNYYYGVDFRKQLYNLNGGIHEAKNSIGAFFNAVRFGIAPDDYLEKINCLMRRYSNMNRNADHYEASNYQYDVRNLYRQIAEDFKRHPEQYQPQSGEGQDGEKENESQQSSQAQNMSQDAKAYNVGDASNMDEKTGMPKLASIIEDTEHDLHKSLEDVQNLIATGLDIKSRLKKGQQDELRDLQRTVELIISNFNKKNSGGCGINTYSGVFNPRAMSRKDYRYFERASSIQGNNRFGTCHLNLFIDCSGSFYHSESLVNGMLAILSEVERKNRNFSMDVVFCGEGVYHCKTVCERQIKCDGGNNLPDNMKEIFLQLQKPNTCNYNIVLFDGDAFSDYFESDKRVRCNKVFSTFDYKQTTLITDSDNERYMGNGFTTAKVVVTDHYTEELLKNVVKALTIAFG